MQRRHVHVEAAVLDRGGDGVAGLQRRHLGAHGVDADRVQAGALLHRLRQRVPPARAAPAAPWRGGGTAARRRSRWAGSGRTRATRGSARGCRAGRSSGPTWRPSGRWCGSRPPAPPRSARRGGPGPGRQRRWRRQCRRRPRRHQMLGGLACNAALPRAAAMARFVLHGAARGIHGHVISDPATRDDDGGRVPDLGAGGRPALATHRWRSLRHGAAEPDAQRVAGRADHRTRQPPGAQPELQRAGNARGGAESLLSQQCPRARLGRHMHPLHAGTGCDRQSPRCHRVAVAQQQAGHVVEHLGLHQHPQRAGDTGAAHDLHRRRDTAAGPGPGLARRTADDRERHSHPRKHRLPGSSYRPYTPRPAWPQADPATGCKPNPAATARSRAPATGSPPPPPSAPRTAACHG